MKTFEVGDIVQCIENTNYIYRCDIGERVIIVGVEDGIGWIYVLWNKSLGVNYNGYPSTMNFKPNDFVYVGKCGANIFQLLGE